MPAPLSLLSPEGFANFFGPHPSFFPNFPVRQSCHFLRGDYSSFPPFPRLRFYIIIFPLSFSHPFLCVGLLIYPPLCGFLPPPLSARSQAFPLFLDRCEWFPGGKFVFLISYSWSTEHSGSVLGDRSSWSPPFPFSDGDPSVDRRGPLRLSFPITPPAFQFQLSGPSICRTSIFFLDAIPHAREPPRGPLAPFPCLPVKTPLHWFIRLSILFPPPSYPLATCFRQKRGPVVCRMCPDEPWAHMRLPPSVFCLLPL